MWVYSVTITVPDDVAEEYVRWIKEVHLQEVLATGCFTKGLFSKVHSDHISKGFQSFNTQYFAETREHLDTYYLEFASRLREKGIQKFGDKMTVFRTELEILSSC